MELNCLIPSEQSISTKKGSKLSDNQIKDLETALRLCKYDQCVELLKAYPVNYKSISQIRRIISKEDQDFFIDWSFKLLELDVVHKIVAGLFLEQSNIWDLRTESTKEIIQQLSVNDDWRIRRTAINLLGKSLIHSQDNFEDLITEFICSNNPFKRRVAVSVAKDISSLSDKYDPLKNKMLDLINPILYEQNQYVITVASDTFANGFLRHHGDQINLWVKSKVKLIEDHYAKAMLLSIYSTQSVAEYLDEALSLIEIFLKDNNEIVKYARSAALRQIAKYDSVKLSSWLEAHLHIKQAVDHWAELEIDGLLGI